MTSQLEQELQDLQQNARTLTKEVRDLFESNIEWLKGETSIAVDEFRQIATGFNDEVLTRTRAARKRQVKQPVKPTRKRAPLQPVVNNTTLPIRVTRSQRRKRTIPNSNRSSPSIHTPTNNTTSPIRKTRRTRTRKQKQVKESPTVSKLNARQLIAQDVRRFEQPNSDSLPDQAPQEDQILPELAQDDDHGHEETQKRVTRKTKKKKQQFSKSSAATEVIDLVSEPEPEPCDTSSFHQKDVQHSESQIYDENDFANETPVADENEQPSRDSQPLQEAFQSVEQEGSSPVASEEVFANEVSDDDAIQSEEKGSSSQEKNYSISKKNKPSSANHASEEDLTMKEVPAEVDEYDNQDHGRQSEVIEQSGSSSAHEDIGSPQEPVTAALASESQGSYQLTRTSTEKTNSVHVSEPSGSVKTKKGRAKKTRNKSGSSAKTAASTTRARKIGKKNRSLENEQSGSPRDQQSPTSSSSVAKDEKEPSTSWQKHTREGESEREYDFADAEETGDVQQFSGRQSISDDDELLGSPQPSSSGSDSEEDTPIVRRFKKATSSTKTPLEKQTDDDPYDSEGTERRASHESLKSSVGTEADRDDDPSFETPNEKLSVRNADDNEENIVHNEPVESEILGEVSPKEDSKDPELVSSSPENGLSSIHRNSTTAATNSDEESILKPDSKPTDSVSKDSEVLESSSKDPTYEAHIPENTERAIAEIAVTTAAMFDGKPSTKPANLAHKFKVNENGQVTGDGLGILSKIVSGPTSSENNDEDGAPRKEEIPAKLTRGGRLFKPTKDIYSSHRKPPIGTRQTVQRSKEATKGKVLSHTPGARAPLSLIKDANEATSHINKPNSLPKHSDETANDLPHIPSNEISRNLHSIQNDTQSTSKTAKENHTKKSEVSDTDRPLPNDKRMVSFKVALKERLKKKAKKSVEFEERRDSLAYIGPSRVKDSEDENIEPMTAPVNKMHGRIQPQSSARPKSALRCRIEAFREGKMSNAVVSSSTSPVIERPASGGKELQDAPSSNSLLPTSFSVGRVKSPTSFSHVPKAIQGLPPGLTKVSHDSNSVAKDDGSLAGQRKSSDKFERIPSPLQGSSEITPEEDIAVQRTARDSSLSSKGFPVTSASSRTEKNSSPNQDYDDDIKLQTSQIESQSIPTQSTPEPSPSESKPLLSNLAGSVKSFLPDAASFFAPRTGEKRRSSSDPEVVAKRQRLEEERREVELAAKREAQRLAKQGLAEERQKRAEARRRLMAEAERAKEEQRRVKEERRLEKKREAERERRRQKEAEDRKKEERRKQVLLKHKAMKDRENKGVKKGLEKGHGSNYKKGGTLGSTTTTEDGNGHDSGDVSKLKKARIDSDHNYIMRSPPADEIKARQSNAGPSSYVITPARDDSDFELSDEEENRRRGKAIPNWAKTPRLASSFEDQVDPDEFFVNVPKCDLSDVFGRRKRYNKVRSSSGNWTRDRITAKEAMAYRKYLNDSDEDE